MSKMTPDDMLRRMSGENTDSPEESEIEIEEVELDAIDLGIYAVAFTSALAHVLHDAGLIDIADLYDLTASIYDQMQANIRFVEEDDEDEDDSTEG